MLCLLRSPQRDDRWEVRHNVRGEWLHSAGPMLPPHIRRRNTGIFVNGFNGRLLTKKQKKREFNVNFNCWFLFCQPQMGENNCQVISKKISLKRGDQSGKMAKQRQIMASEFAPKTTKDKTSQKWQGGGRKTAGTHKRACLHARAIKAQIVEHKASNTRPERI